MLRVGRESRSCRFYSNYFSLQKNSDPESEIFQRICVEHSFVLSWRGGICPDVRWRPASLVGRNYRTLHGRTLLKDLQLPLGNRKFSEATMYTDHKLWKNPNDGFLQTFHSGKMNSNFTVKNALHLGMASFTGQGNLQGIRAVFILGRNSQGVMFKN